MKSAQIRQAYALAKEQYAAYGVDTEKALKRLARIPISLHCWQGDDVCGFESGGGISDGGIQATGNYPGKARNAEELRADLAMAFRMAPGRQRVNLHAIYAEMGSKKVARNELQPRHFAGWIDWAKSMKIGLDYNGSFFSHPLAASGFTLSHGDRGVRQFWIEHAIGSRQIGAAMGRALDNPCVVNLWIPDGFKDVPANRGIVRQRLKDALDVVYTTKYSPKVMLDALESKLFGLGSESCVIGSHEFYMGYAMRKNLLLCLDTGHYHPTESIADKISSLLLYLDGLLLHVSRGIRWDSDHVVILSDDLRMIAEEIVRCEALDRVHIGLDFFDASINRVAAWVIGTRNMLKALLIALMEPSALLRTLEKDGDFTARLAMLEELKSLPFAAVWDYHCLRNDVPIGDAWLAEVRKYEKNVQLKRK